MPEFSLKWLIRWLHNLYRDLRFGGRSLGLPKLPREPHKGMGFFGVENSSYEDLELLFSHCRVGPDDVLVDVGCGPGRVLNFFLGRYPANRVVGLEFDPEWAGKTRERLKRYPNVEIVEGDALENIPPDGTVFYMFNPFGQPHVRIFLEKIKELGRDKLIQVVYYQDQFISQFREDPDCRIEEVSIPRKFGASVIRLGPLT